MKLVVAAFVGVTVGGVAVGWAIVNRAARVLESLEAARPCA